MRNDTARIYVALFLGFAAVVLRILFMVISIERLY